MHRSRIRDIPSANPPLGAHWDGRGTCFSLLAPRAHGVWVCLFDSAPGGPETDRIPMEVDSAGVWRVYLQEVGPEQLYGFRLDGTWDPQQGYLTRPSQLLVDPYARDIVGTVDLNEPIGESATWDDPSGNTAPKDTAAWMPKARVVDPAFSWSPRELPNTPREGSETSGKKPGTSGRKPSISWENTLIYECHVKGLTAQHPEIPPPLRGTFLGMSQPCILEHLVELGVTAVELMPVQTALTEPRLTRLGLTNYWGYNPIGFFSPDRRFCATDDPTREFKTLVQALHDAGIEVILDVVFNHTAEGGHSGPILHLKGIDNLAYYRPHPDDPKRYEDFTGCGNTLAIGNEPARRLVLDALRYWSRDMGVDGFRFDLAPVLGRDHTAFEAQGQFFRELREDPVLASLKLMAEPWDLGPEGYRLGHFPAPWGQWNDRYRDATRSFWRGDPGQLSELATRISGSSDLFPQGPVGSINMITCHDGFTLRDLVTYRHRRNLANREDGRDGHGHNLSHNWGVEGETDDPKIRQQRLRIQKALLATLAFSRGTPLLSHGDELCRTQLGNNNAYCHDSQLTWVDWTPDQSQQSLLPFCREIFSLRRRYPQLRGIEPLVLEPAPGRDHGTWLKASGQAMESVDWNNSELRSIGLLVARAPEGQREAAAGWSGEIDGENSASEPTPCSGSNRNPDSDSRRVTQGPGSPSSLLLLINGSTAAKSFRLPKPSDGKSWRTVLDTARFPERRQPGVNSHLLAHSLQLLVASSEADGEPREV